MKIKIDNHTITVEQGTSVLKAAEAAGITIPTMCYSDEVEHFTSCMICLVKDARNGKLIPSCSINVQDGMEIITMDEEVIEARKTALELLLSEHVGDCEAPCTMACPAHMDIPQMNRLLAAGKIDEALAVVKKDIALPSVLGRICPAPCEGVCRRKPMDGSVSICMLKRFAGDIGKMEENPAPSTGKKVAIIGSGASGLAAAYHLQLKGINCAVFDKEVVAGGSLRENPEDKLPAKEINREIKAIENIGVSFNLNVNVEAAQFKKLQTEYDAIVIASGKFSEEQKDWGIDCTDKGFKTDTQSYQTNIEKVFAIGSSVKFSKLVIRNLAQGKEVAESVSQFLQGETIIGQPQKFNSRFGKLVIPEFAEYLKESVEGMRIEPSEGIAKGLSIEEVKAEAARCLHCDCRKVSNCKLRDYSDEYKAEQKRFSYGERKPVRKIMATQGLASTESFTSSETLRKTNIVYEPEKCIKCGLCVRLTEKHQEEFGMTFIGRGFDVEIGIPFNVDLDKGISKVALKVAEACPTGALSKK